MKKEQGGALTRVNDELLAEAKQQTLQALAIAKEYGLPVVDALLMASGIPGPFATMAASTIKFAVDEIIKNNTEDAEIRALNFQCCVAHSQQYSNAYKSVTAERLRFLYQGLTRKAVEVRQEDRVRVIVAATLGGSDADLASADDLVAAEWLEAAPDSKLRILIDLCQDLFGPSEIPEITPKPDDGLFDLYTPCVKHPTFKWFKPWQNKTTWWVNPQLGNELFGPVNTMQVWNETKVATRDITKPDSQYFGWPSPMLQRVHNAFVRSKQMMSFDLKRAVETVKPAKT